MSLTYFTEDEFRELVRDEKSPERYTTEAIERAHDEVVERLEAWARTSWLSQTATKRRWVNRARVLLDKIPVIEVTTFTLDGTAVDEDSYDLDPASGEVRWGSNWRFGAPWFPQPVLVEMEWEYGLEYAPAGTDGSYGDPIPWSIKRPAILACRSLMLPQTRDANIPSNARTYNTGRTSFDLRNPRSQTRPWPWDDAMSAQVRAAYEPYRFRQYVS